MVKTRFFIMQSLLIFFMVLAFQRYAYASSAQKDLELWVGRLSSNYDTFYQRVAINKLVAADTQALPIILKTMGISKDRVQLKNLFYVLERLIKNVPDLSEWQNKYPILTKYVEYNDKEFCDSAIILLGYFDTQPVADFLVEALQRKSYNENQRKLMLKALLQQKKVKLSPNRLIPLLVKLQSETAKQYLLSLVLRNSSGTVVSSEAYNLLLRQLLSYDKEVRELARKLVNIYAKNHLDELKDFYKKLSHNEIQVPLKSNIVDASSIANSLKYEAQKDLIKALATTRNKYALDFLYDIASSVTDNGRYYVWEALASIKDTGAMDVALMVLKRNDEVLLKQVMLYVKAESSLLRPKIIKMIDMTPLSEYRVNLARALREIGGPGSIFALAKLLNSDLASERAVAEVCIIEMKNKYIPDFIEAIKSSDPYLRSVAIKALYKMRFSDPRYKEDIELALRDSIKTVRSYAHRILKEFYKSAK